MPVHVDAAVELVHRLVGYPLAFLVAPIALASFAGADGHRWSGKLYVALMTFLYVTGTSLTLTRHDWATWEFGRNVVFNLLGYSFLLYGFRSMWLLSHPRTPRPGRLDAVLLGLMVTLVAAMTLLAIPRNTPLRVFSILGMVLVAIEIREWRDGFLPADLWRRHIRYMLASYFYVLTVVSLVHLRDELAPNARWLWPAALGVAVIWATGRTRVPGLQAVRFRRADALRWGVLTTLVVGLGFGAYAMFDLMRVQ